VREETIGRQRRIAQRDVQRIGGSSLQRTAHNAAPMKSPEERPDDRTASHLARNLVSLRHTRALTQDGLAKAAAVPRSTIANLESGDGNPSLAVLVKVAGALGVPIDELLAAKKRAAATLNDVCLAAVAGALRALARSRGAAPEPLKAMVPVSVRAPQERWGNRIAFLFPPLPTDEPDPVKRLRGVHEAMCSRKRAREPEAADRVIEAVGRMPRIVRAIGARLLTSRRLYNLTISNVPGPASPLYLLGCEVERVYPAVPLARGHGVSICMTSFNGVACFGIYADASRAAAADRLAHALGEAIDDLVARSQVRDEAAPARRGHDRTRDNSRNPPSPGAASAPQAAAA
jgi:WS/DGAT/MGAT family acyltransferase